MYPKRCPQLGAWLRLILMWNSEVQRDVLTMGPAFKAWTLIEDQSCDQSLGLDIQKGKYGTYLASNTL